MNTFIYALNQKDRELLISKGYEELFSARLNGNDAWAFYNNLPSRYATFSDEEKKKFFLSDVAIY